MPVDRRRTGIDPERRRVLRFLNGFSQHPRCLRPGSEYLCFIVCIVPAVDRLTREIDNQIRIFQCAYHSRKISPGNIAGTAGYDQHLISHFFKPGFRCFPIKPVPPAITIFFFMILICRESQDSAWPGVHRVSVWQLSYPGKTRTG